MLRENWNNKLKISIIVLVILLFSGCRSQSSIQYADDNSDLLIVKKIEQQYQTWYKTPYHYGGNSLNGIDCSAFVHNFYRQKLNIFLPRVTTEQLKSGKPVSELKAGDLVFFKTGKGEKGMHVGIYYKDGNFLHVSTSQGVKFSNLNEKYWQQHYVQAKRFVN
ncbi:NlpC/P60 family protein [Orbus sturtevantii]|uniref:C40 family peptidase n=1 Tax=Orbus sturtevantii TaxID=3074109 RepID=UPI00370D7C79